MSKLKLRKPPSRVVKNFKEYIQEYFINEMDWDDFYYDIVEDILYTFFTEEEFYISLDVKKGKVVSKGFYCNIFGNIDPYVISFDEMIKYFIEGYSPDKKAFNCLIQTFKEAILKLEKVMKDFKEKIEQEND